MGVSKQNKTYASRYKTDVSVSQTSNVGFDSTTRVVCSGDGADSALSLSDDVLSVQPVNDDTTGTMLVKNQGGSNILAVDTTNSRVLVGASQVNCMTLFKDFGLFDANMVAGSHHLLDAGNFRHYSGAASLNPTVFGTGASPDLSVTIGANPEIYLTSYWLLSNNITLDEVQIMAACDGDTTMNFHVLSLDVVTGSGSTAGDLSAGVYNAANGSFSEGSPSLSPLTVENDRATITTLTIDTADIDSGKVILATAENVGGTDDVTCQLNIKYHIR